MITSDTTLRLPGSASLFDGLPIPRHVRLALHGLGRIGVALVLPLSVLGLWWLSTSREWVSPQILPAPAVVWDSAVSLWQAGDILGNLFISIKRVLAGFGIGAVVGLALGLGFGVSRRFERFVYPTFEALVQVPALGYIPLLMMFLGIGEALKLTLIAKAVVVPVAINTMHGIRGVPTAWLELAQIHQLDRLRTILTVIVPAALPGLVTGLRYGLSHAWLTLVTVELLASSEGIGYLMVWGRQLFQLDVVLVTVFIIGLVGLVLDGLLRLTDRLLPHSATNAVGVAKGATTPSGWAGVILPLSIVAVWYAATTWHWVDTRLVATPQAVLQVAWQQIGDGEVFTALRWSLQRLLLGLAIGASLGLAGGLLLGQSRLVDRLVSPSLHAFRQVALFAWIPLLSLWFGAGEVGKVAFVALASFIPVLINTYDGVRGVAPIHLELSRTLVIPPLRRWWWLVLPSAAPQIVTGLRLALIYAWLGTIGAEYFLKAAPGIGNLMIDGREHFHMDLVLFGVVVVGLIGFAISRLANTLEHRLIRWRPRSS